jgi:nitrate/TMAO reductase-like tetraheme cytochrome c subunit
MLPLAATVKAASEADHPQECLSCHSKTLEFHDKLGSGNNACLACHDNPDMKMLRLADKTLLPLADSTQLCGQCHQERYAAWQEGTHGFAGTVAAVKCTGCHDPHQPKITFVNITKPHPEPAPPPPAPPVNLVAIFAVSLAVMITVGVIGARRGEGP